MHNNGNHLGAPQRAAVLAVMAGAALLTAACGGSSSSASGSGGSSATGASAIHAKQLAFAQCMRSHGVPSYPDSGLAVAKGSGSGGSSPQSSSGINPQSPQFQAAQQACRHLLPNGGQITPAQQRQQEEQLLKLAQCMHAHGVPDFPEPNGQGQLQVPATTGSDLNPNSPQFQAAQKACRSAVPAGPRQAP